MKFKCKVNLLGIPKLNTVQLIYEVVTTTIERHPQKLEVRQKKDAKYGVVLAINRVRCECFKRLGEQKQGLRGAVALCVAVSWLSNRNI